MSQLFDVTGRVALVTGSTRGLGRSLVGALAEAGAHVVVHGRDGSIAAAVAEEVAHEHRVESAAVSFDVTHAEETRAAIDEMIRELGVPDILVNNAGVQRRAPIQEFAPDDWDALVAANLSGAFYVSRYVTPGMVSRGSGKVVNVASVQSKLARQTIAPYSATKGGLVQLTRGMAADLARYNVQVNALSPGYFATEMNRDLVEDPAFTAWLKERTPAGRWGDVAELHGALIFLCSAASSFVSGQNLFVDGGMTAVV